MVRFKLISLMRKIELAILNNELLGTVCGKKSGQDLIKLTYTMTNVALCPTGDEEDK